MSLNVAVLEFLVKDNIHGSVDTGHLVTEREVNGNNIYCIKDIDSHSQKIALVGRYGSDQLTNCIMVLGRTYSGQQPT
jgi:hypothetical protein